MVMELRQGAFITLRHRLGLQLYLRAATFTILEPTNSRTKQEESDIGTGAELVSSQPMGSGLLYKVVLLLPIIFSESLGYILDAANQNRSSLNELHIFTGKHFMLMKNNAISCNIGHSDCMIQGNRSSHLGIHKQTNACWTL